MSNRSGTDRRRGARRVVVMGGLAAAAGAAVAMPLDTGNDDLAVRWDNTVKYNVGVRMKDQEPALINVVAAPVGGAVVSNALNGDDGDRNFRKHGLISNRLDLLSEFDLIYKRTSGLRISAAAWYDAVYNRSNSNDSPATNNSLTVPFNEFTNNTRTLHGRKAEVLDAFVFGSTDVGSMRLSGRLGRHTLLWGESLFFGNNGISGTQAPVDAIKASSVPGSTTKEILMPVGQLSGALQITDEFALMSYYQFEWRRSRLPAAGSYFSSTDVLDAGGERLRAGAPGLPGNGFLRGDQEAKDSGQGGVGVKGRIGQFDVGAYAVRFHAKTPVIYVRPGGAGAPGASIGAYELVFPQGIRAFGASASTSVDAVNYAAEVSVRRGTPLTSNAQTVPATVTANNGSNPFYAIGNSAHALMSVLWTLPPSAISAEASLSAEVAFNRLTGCERNCTPTAFNSFRATGALDPNATKDAYGARVTYAAPQRNVFDGLDLTPSISGSYYRGRSSVVVLGPDRGGDVTLALGANYLTVWDVSMSFTYYYGPTNTSTYASTVAALNGTNTYAQTLRDRNFLALSVRRTF